jgi:hypothetical protein
MIIAREAARAAPAKHVKHVSLVPGPGFSGRSTKHPKEIFNEQFKLEWDHG